MTSAVIEGVSDPVGFDIPLGKRLELGLLWAGVKETLGRHFPDGGVASMACPVDVESLDRVVSDVVAFRPLVPRAEPAGSVVAATGQAVSADSGACRTFANASLGFPGSEDILGGGSARSPEVESYDGTFCGAGGLGRRSEVEFSDGDQGASGFGFSEVCAFPGEASEGNLQGSLVSLCQRVRGVSRGTEPLRVGAKVSFSECVQTLADAIGLSEQAEPARRDSRDPDATFGFVDLCAGRVSQQVEAEQLFDYRAVCVRRSSDVSRAFRDVAKEGALLHGYGRRQLKVLDLARSAVGFHEVVRALQGTLIDLVVTLPDECDRAVAMSQTTWLEWAAVAYPLSRALGPASCEGCLLRPLARGEASLAFVVSAEGASGPRRGAEDFLLMLPSVGGFMPRVAANCNGLCYLNFFQPKHRLALAFEHGLCPRAEALNLSYGLDVGYSVWLSDVGGGIIHVSPREKKGGLRLKLQVDMRAPALKDKRYGLQRLLQLSKPSSDGVGFPSHDGLYGVRCGSRSDRDLSRIVMERGAFVGAGQVAALYGEMVVKFNDLSAAGWHVCVTCGVVEQFEHAVAADVQSHDERAVRFFRRLICAVDAMAVLTSLPVGDYVASSGPVCLRKLDGTQLDEVKHDKGDVSDDDGFESSESEHDDCGSLFSGLSDSEEEE